MGVDYYIYTEIDNEQYLIGEGRYEIISRWYDMLLAYKSPSLIAIVYEGDYYENRIGNNEIDLELESHEQYGKFRFQKIIKLKENTQYIDPYDLEHEWYKLLLHYEAWNALSEKERKRISDEKLKEALRIAKEGSDGE